MKYKDFLPYKYLIFLRSGIKEDIQKMPSSDPNFSHKHRMPKYCYSIAIFFHKTI